LAATVGLLALVGCDGSTNRRTSGSGDSGDDLRLSQVQYGRLVDVFAYRRVDPLRAQRRDVANRVPVLVARDVLIDPRIESQQLFDAAGEEDPNADFEFRPFNVAVGHDELLILWDDQSSAEKARFDEALRRAQASLESVAPAFAGQNTTLQPIPVVPRNAALKLTFSRDLGVDSGYFIANPSSLQLLEIVGDVEAGNPQRALRSLPYRIIARGNEVIVDTTLLGGEIGIGGRTSTGLPESVDQTAANIRIALPVTSVGGSLKLKRDSIGELNGLDRLGAESVIRDFRTGNAADGRVGRLVDTDSPMIVADVPMGIVHIDAANRVLTLNKRFSRVTLRGRVPFVVGPLRAEGSPQDRLPLGPGEAPTVVPLRSGDFVSQTVLTPGGPVTIRAEIIKNMDVFNEGVLGPNNPNVGRAADGTDGGDAQIVRVQLASLSTTDAAGNTATFEASDLPLGQECVARVHYYEHVPYKAGSTHAVSDSTRRFEFISFDPATPTLDDQRRVIPRGTRINPNAAVSLRFSEPIALETAEAMGNFVITNRFVSATNLINVMRQPKPSALSIVAARLDDFEQDGTVLRLTQPMGHPHLSGQEETYFLHVLVGDSAPRDLSGNGLDLFDRQVSSLQKKSFSASYTLDGSAADNLVGYQIKRFESIDEDGTKPGSPDFFGQFQLRDGRLGAAAVSRVSKVADSVRLGTITRGDHGECLLVSDPMGMPPRPNPAHLVWGPLYTTPSMTQVTIGPPPNPFTPPFAPMTYGGITGPLNPRGMRMQATYREDDFQLGYHDPAFMMIDVEQLHWAPWNNEPVLFDSFDRYTMRLGHAHKRPDLRAELFGPPMTVPQCRVDCASLRSGIDTSFDDNPLLGLMTTVVNQKSYTISPEDSFRDTTRSPNVYIPYARFENTFTWRDGRLVSWDNQRGAATGLGGSIDPLQTSVPPADTTTNVSSPWELDIMPLDTGGTPQVRVPTPSGIHVMDPGDFHGDRRRDLDPIALPLLVEWQLWPVQGNPAVKGVNRMHIGYVGINGHQSPNWGYFNLGVVPTPPAGAHWGRQYYPPGVAGGQCGGFQYPSFTVHSGGFIDQNQRQTVVDPSQARIAKGSIILDAGSTDVVLGLTNVPPANDHLLWAQADFVRRVSMVTFGFFDTLRPNRHALTAAQVSDWPEGIAATDGLPNWSSNTDRRVRDVVAILDPPIDAQPAGTEVTVEVRTAQTLGNASTAADPWDLVGDQDLPGQQNPRTALTRFNLLNPHFACDAYRYATANPSRTPNQPEVRVPATDLTPYAEVERIDGIRNPANGLLGRYLNYRLIMENDITVSAPRVPGLRSMAIVYRLQLP
jgi:hypothetical protein